MTYRLAFTPAADLDLYDQAAYIAGDNLPAAVRFYAKVREACESLLRWPEMGARVQAAKLAAHELRMLPVPDFRRHLIFYRIEHDSILIVRILHSARDIPAIFP